MVHWIFISLFSVFTEHLFCANVVGAGTTVENKTASDSAFLESTDLTETQTYFSTLSGMKQHTSFSSTTLSFHNLIHTHLPRPCVFLLSSLSSNHCHPFYGPNSTVAGSGEAPQHLYWKAA